MSKLQELEASLTRDYLGGWECRHFDTVTSTMDEARILRALLGPQKWGIVVADEQRAGRGRQGRDWSSRPGGMYLTIVIPLSGSAGALAGLSLAVGVVVCEVLARRSVPVQLKWPNDLINAHGEKVGGILIEILHSSGEISILIGVGINLENELDSLAERPVYGAGRLDSVTLRGAAHLVAAEICLAVRRKWETFLRFGFEPFRKEWLELCSHLAATIEIDTDGIKVRGVCAGLDTDGALLVDDGLTVRRIVSGHVVQLHPASKVEN